MKPKKGGKPLRVKVTTTLSADLWKELQIEAIKQGRDANDIIEELMASYLKKTKRKEGN
jgi:hypothetical protein